MTKGLILDSTLGRLAKWLRFMGIDTLYLKEGDTATIELLALKTGRIIVTKSHKLEGREKLKTVIIDSENLKCQIKELSERIDIIKAPPFIHTPIIKLRPAKSFRQGSHIARGLISISGST